MFFLALSGGGTWHYDSSDKQRVLNGMLTIVIDPKRLGTQTSFAEESLAFIDWLRESPDAPDSEGVLIAGEPERKARADRLKNGIVVDDATWQEILGAAQKLGISL